MRNRLATSLVMLLLSVGAAGQAYPSRPLQDIYGTIRADLSSGKRPDRKNLLEMGFVQKGESSYELDTGYGKLRVLLTQQFVVVGWNPEPKQNQEKLSDAVFAALISRSKAIEVIAPGKLRLTLPSTQSLVMLEDSVTVGLDGSVYAEVVTAMVH